MNRGLHRYVLFLAGATFLLLMAGALVTSHDAGLATSDWPRSNGQWFPRMVGNLFWEHGHRMVATAIGMLTTGLAGYLFAVDVFFFEIVRLVFRGDVRGLLSLIGALKNKAVAAARFKRAAIMSGLSRLRAASRV